MKRLISLFILICLAYGLFAQSNDVLITIGDRKFTKDEFVRIYKKNNSNLINDSEKKTPEEYVDLFVNYKLKVIEAENLGMDTIPEFVNELAKYRKELAEPYLTDVTYDKKLVEDTYQRMITEVKASHLLVTIGNNQTPDDTLKAYQKIMKIRDEILNGLSFREAAINYSEDPSAATNHGDLGYFSAFQMVYPFEEAAFNTPVGGISMPVRTSYGYHLLKVEDKRDAKGEIKVAHIMKAFPKDVDATIMKKLKNEIDSVYQKLQNGADFAKLAEKYSDDKNSAPNGGELNWFSSGRMIADFADAAFALENDGDYTEPIITPYGYHIIKRLAIRPVKSFDEVKDDIERRIKNDPGRSVHSKDAFLVKLKSDYNFNENKKVSALVANNEFPLFESDNGSLNEELFNLAGKAYTVRDFYDFMAEMHPGIKNFDQASFKKYFNEWSDSEILAYEDSKLEEKHPDFRYLMEEYHDGILLFNISDEKIWSYASQDSIGLQKFYNKNKGKYLWDERFKGMIVKCDNQETRDEVEKYFSGGMTAAEVLDMVNTDGTHVTIEEGTWEEDANPIVNYYVWNGEKPEGFNEELQFVRGDKIGPEPKKLDEAKGLYLSDYQNFLEAEWIKELRRKYKVKVDKKLLKTIDDASE